MRTEIEIYMDFNKVEKLIEKLRQIATSMDKLSEDGMGASLTELRRNWKGDNANTFTSKGEAVKTGLDRTVADIRNTADSLEKMAMRLRDAEIENIRIAGNSGSK